MLMTCPTCGGRSNLEAFIGDDSAREMMLMLGKLPDTVSRPLVSYLGLFRSATRALAWPRALRLAQEVVALSDHARLAEALSNTVETMRPKQQSPGWKPLSNNNYLKRVLETVEGTAVVANAGASTPTAAPTSKAGKAASRLEERAQGSS